MNALVACLVLSCPAARSGESEAATVGPEGVAAQVESAVEDGPAHDLWEALAAGRFWLDLRYRFEHVSTDLPLKDADASTLRTVLGYESAPYEGLRVFLEFEDVTEAGGDAYNDTTNGKTDHAVVADPDGTEANQVYVGYAGIEGLDVRIGRQEILLGNQRFVGNVGWRQNHQSYDGLRLTSTQIENVTLDYSLIFNVNRIFGNDSPIGDETMVSHLFNVRSQIESAGELTGYAYLLEFDESDALSTNTFGARLAGTHGIGDIGGTSGGSAAAVALSYVGEYARQVDGSGNPVDVDADYYVAELGLAHRGWKVALGNEHLGGSGDAGDKFTTPLATLHSHNGYADLFLVTPDTGIEDRYVSLRGSIANVALEATYHVFEADTGSLDYGKELDLQASVPIKDHFQVGVKFADYRADDLFDDTQKVMAWLGIKAF